MLERLCWKERAGESRREEERAGERRREKEIVRKKALLIHHHVRILPTQSQSGIRRSTRNGTVHETPPTNFSNKWRTRALPSYCNWFCMKSRARVSVLAKNSIYDIKIFDPQKSQNSWLSRSAPGSWYNLEFDQNLSPDGSIASREIIFLKSGSNPLPKPSRICREAFVFNFTETLVGKTSRSDSRSILEF